MESSYWSYLREECSHDNKTGDADGESVGKVVQRHSENAQADRLQEDAREEGYENVTAEKPNDLQADQNLKYFEGKIETQPDPN